MKKLIYLMILMFGVVANPSVFASVYQGNVLSVYPYNGMVYVLVGGGAFAGSATSCNIGIDGMIFVLDQGTPFGRTLLATALTAKVSGKIVYATGNGNCGNWNPYNGLSNESLIGMDLKG